MPRRERSDAGQAASRGRLLVCATPIGNLGDVTLRVLDALRSADVIEAEDTRITRRLLARNGISTPMEPYHAKNLERRTGELVARVERGDTVALVSDAGTPGVSDPGAMLVSACLDAGLEVDVLPGASAILAALVASGLPTHAFYFGGFLPRKAGERAKRVAAVRELDATLIFYEAPGRAGGTAAALAQALPGRQAAMARELTKVHEEVLRAPIEELAAALEARELKGEVVLLVGPPARGGRPTPDAATVARRMSELMESGLSRKDAARRVSEETGVSRRAAYEVALRAADAGP